ncbi:MAG: tetratricopeptide repeat protein [Alphaproteobacteria bacterium]|nr:tetratricopeptide repeat protein [Alphaproteobacteria bacterium]
MPDALPTIFPRGMLSAAEPTEQLNHAIDVARASGFVAAEHLFNDLSVRLPYWDEVPLRIAEAQRRGGNPRAAALAYEAALRLNPRRPEALLGLGVIVLGCGQISRAQSLFLRCCGIAPDLPEGWDALGNALMLSGDQRAAESAFAEATRLAPGRIDMAVHRAEAALACGEGAGEIGRLRISLTGDPANPAMLTALAMLLEAAQERDEAIECLEVAAALAPEDLAPQRMLALCLVRANRVHEALDALDCAIAVAPEDLGLRNNRAAAMIRLHRFGEAHDDLVALLAEHGDQGGLLNNLSNCLVSLGRQDEGVAVARKAIANEPETAQAWRTLCNALPYAEGIGGSEMLAATRRAARVLPRLPAAPWLNNPAAERPLRIGLLSPTLKTHPVGWLTVAGFETLDPSRFELHCLGPEHGSDAIHRRFKAVAASWTRLDGRSPADIVAICRARGLDIVIDLGGNGDQGMLGVCANRLAPVQVKWVGSQNHSTGLAEMDWFIADHWEIPEGFERFYSERILRLDDGYVCYSPPPYAPDVAPLPALATGRVTFGCFNNLAKITRGAIAAWADILREVPGSRLAIMCHQMSEAPTRARLLDAFSQTGIGHERIELLGGAPHTELLRRYGRVDIALDPFPYSGGLTTCEALWMGVPVVTMPGETFASRHSASHLANIGLADWVAEGPDGYRRLAVEKARDITALTDVRHGLRRRMAASPLCDGPRFGRSLGNALRHAWRDWCGQRGA